MALNFEYEYLRLIFEVLDRGESKFDRTGIGTISSFGQNIKFDCSEEPPVITMRKIFTKGIIGEYCAFMRGFTKNKDFKKFGCNYWTPWADENGNLGSIYGRQWRKFNEDPKGDQIKQLIKTAKKNPESRQMVVTAWNPLQMNEMALPPCFHSFQVLINKNKLNIQVNQRSADIMIGLPSDAILHYLLMLTLCKEIGTSPGLINFSIGDAHIYRNHLSKVYTFLDSSKGNPGKILLKDYKNINSLCPDNFKHIDYDPGPNIKFEINI